MTRSRRALGSIAAAAAIAVLIGTGCTGKPCPVTPPASAGDGGASAGIASVAAQEVTPPAPDGLIRHADERHLASVRQLTFGGENAEAYFSRDDRRLIFQSTRGEHKCDQMFTMGVDGSDVRLVSTGKGRTTCGYFVPDGSRILYSSTHLASPDCPPKPDMSRGYVWALYDSFDIFTARPDGNDLRRLTETIGYDAEATIAADGSRIVFTSVRDGDIDLYSMSLDGSDVRRLTREKGYDGGAFFSPDGKRIVYRAHHPTDEAAVRDYESLLALGLVRPTKLEIFVMDADGGNNRQVTSLGAASFAPFWHPDGKRIIFASNAHDPKGRNFDLYLAQADGTVGPPERVTFDATFDGFPMFSHDGEKLVFASNRNGKVQGETNIFIADWVD